MKFKDLLEAFDHPLGPIQYLPKSTAENIGKELGISSQELFNKLNRLYIKVNKKYNKIPIPLKEIFEKLKTVISIGGNLAIYKQILNFLSGNNINETAIILGLIFFILGSHKEYKNFTEAIIQRIKYIIGDYVFFATLDIILPLLNGGVPEMGGLFRNIILMAINTVSRKILKSDSVDLPKESDIQKLINSAIQGNPNSIKEIKNILKNIKKYYKNK